MRSRGRTLFHECGDSRYGGGAGVVAVACGY